MQPRKRLLIGITASIAAYKSILLIRELVQQNYEVRVVMTPSATKFIAPLIFQTISGHPVLVDLFQPETDSGMEHIELARWADLMLIVPATANFIAKMAQGLGDDLLSTLYLASPQKVAIVPAMNKKMWQHPATQDNIKTLRLYQVEIWGPTQGVQACGDVGLGRMLDLNDILIHIESTLSPKFLKNIKVMVTAGATREAIDPVRYITNRSSGKMGYAIAQKLAAFGADVTLVSGVVSIPALPHIKTVKIESANEMFDAVMQSISEQDIFIGCAAVADYHIKNPAVQKIKKSGAEISLELLPNKDILAAVAACKNPPFTLGFAAETENLVAYAKAKMARKKINMIAANQVGGRDGGFETNHNALTVLWQNGFQELPLTDKNQLAEQLIHLLSDQFYAIHPSKNPR